MNMNEAIEAMREFSRVMQDGIDRASWSIAPKGRTVTDVVWEGPPLRGDGFIREEMRVTITLDNGDRLVGEGGGKLDALVAIERALSDHSAARSAAQADAS